MKELKELKQGDFFTLIEIEYPTERQVFIKGEYDRSLKAYFCTRFNDVNDYRIFKGTKKVFTDFTF